VDALCIIQDSEVDKAIQINTIDNIYRNSTVVIAAATAISVDEGFLHSRPFPKSIKLPFRCFEKNIGDVWLTPKVSSDMLEEEPLASRAWAFQETSLANRRIIYTKRGICLDCRGSSGFPEIDSVLRIGRTASRAAISQLLKILADPGGILQKWNSILEKYTKLECTFHSDRLPALAGMAKQFQLITKDKYLAGMWQQDLMLQLGWQCGRIGEMPTPTNYQAPSWAWSSANGRIRSSRRANDYDLDTRLEVICCEVEPLQQEAPLGQVKAGFLKVSAFILPSSQLPRPWRLTAIIDYSEFLIDTDNLDDSIICMILGFRSGPGPDLPNGHPYAYWEGLFLENLADNTFRRIGLFRQEHYIDALDMFNRPNIGTLAELPECARRLQLLLLCRD
jgi:hypothetical protein